jgi:hypothetical protein
MPEKEIELNDCLANCKFSKALLAFMRDLRDAVGDTDADSEMTNDELLALVKKLKAASDAS